MYTIVYCAVIIVLLVLFIRGVTAQNSLYPYEEVLDNQGHFVLRWSVTDTEIFFETSVLTTGYIGLGISASGQMVPADMVIGWVAHGDVYFGDYHTVDSRVPVMDTSQDWQITEGYESNGTTVLRFRRRLDTCDPNDEKITRDTMRIIYSYNENDPNLAAGLIPHHGLDKRGTKTMTLLERDIIPPDYPPQNTYMIEFRNYGFTIPPTGSRRQCLVHNMKLPLSHVIKYEPIITQGNEKYIYRIILFKCNITDHTTDRNSFECENAAPINVKACKSTVVNWATGTKAFHFPENVGLPIGGEKGRATYVLEIHYTNYEFTQGIQDSSGVRVYYTTQLRQYEAGLLDIGQVITPGWRALIPPGEDRVTAQAFCSPRCLEWGIVTGQALVKPFGILFQGNDVATSMRLRHFRNNIELPAIAEDNAYTNLLQVTRRLSNLTIASTDILPEDVLSLECVYNTTGRQVVTRGGYARADEMCRASLFYYPRKPIDICLSWSSMDGLSGADGLPIPGDDVISYFNNVTDWSPAMKETLQNAIQGATERVLCSAQNRNPAYAIDRYRKPMVMESTNPPSSCLSPPSTPPVTRDLIGSPPKNLNDIRAHLGSPGPPAMSLGGVF